MAGSESASADAAHVESQDGSSEHGGHVGLRKVDLESARHGVEDHAGPLPGIRLSGGFRFRRGQEIFLYRLADALRRGDMNHLVVFVPGYGKTITALASFVLARSLGAAEPFVVFVPRGNLRDQYADPHELSRIFRNLGAPLNEYDRVKPLRHVAYRRTRMPKCARMRSVRVSASRFTRRPSICWIDRPVTYSTSSPKR